MDSAIRCIAKEMPAQRICLNSIAPSTKATELYRHYLEKYGEDSETNRELLKRQYLGIAETSDIANAAAFLISPAARFITGITLPVDGGLTTC
jgi:NAD(P)-dependent dehydrogenase (short-subunit alcohol dehydrogenase family)